MAIRNVYNGILAQLSLSSRVLGDGADAQRVEAIPADDIPVSMTAGNSRFTCTTTVTLSSKLPGAGEEYAILEAQVADILYWDKGLDPATTPGHILGNGTAMRISKSQFANFKLIQAAAGAIAVLSAYKNV